MISHFCLVYPVYIFFTWFFIYLVKVRGITVSKAGFWVLLRSSQMSFWYRSGAGFAIGGQKNSASAVGAGRQRGWA